MDDRERSMMVAFIVVAAFDIFLLLEGVDMRIAFPYSAIIFLLVWVSPYMYDSGKLEADQLILPGMGPLHCTTIEPIHQTQGDEKVPAWGLWAWGGCTALGFNFKDGGSAIRAGGYIIAPLRNAVRLSGHRLYIPVQVNDYESMDGYPLWAKTSIMNLVTMRRLSYDKARSSFHWGWFSVLEPKGPTHETAQMEQVLKDTHLRMNDLESIAKDAQGTMVQVHKNFRSLVDPRWYELQKKKQMKDMQRQEEVHEQAR